MHALVSKAVGITALNKKVVTGDNIVFTPSFGTITGDNANHKWTSNVIAKWDAEKQGYVITAKSYGNGAETPSITLASGEILISTHYDSTIPVSVSNHELMMATKVGDILTFYGCTPASNKKSVGSYFTITEGFDDGDIDEDGRVGATDFLALKQYFKKTLSFSDGQIARADINKDGMVSSLDIIALKNQLKN